MIIPWQAILGAYIVVGIIAFIAGIYICYKSSEFSENEKMHDEEKGADMEGAKRYFKIVNK